MGRLGYLHVCGKIIAPARSAYHEYQLRLQTVSIAVSIIYSVYAGRGYARHEYYLTPPQVVEALKLNVIARSMYVISIGLGKISVALLIERIAPPGDWRKWLLRGISLSMAVTAITSIALYYAECNPTRALWDKKMVQDGTGKCLDPVPVNIFHLVCGGESTTPPLRNWWLLLNGMRHAGYWAFLDFALAIIPVDIIWWLQISKKQKLSLCILLSMGVL